MSDGGPRVGRPGEETAQTAGEPAAATGPSPTPAGTPLGTPVGSPGSSPVASSLLRPLPLAGRVAPSRVLFGPHETNLARGRTLSDRHVAYYTRRAAGGAGVIVTETASVTADDWPYERAPLAADCGPGWADLARAVRPYGTLVLAGLGHAGGQGSSAYSQRVLWAPSPVADAASRELPAELEQPQIDEIVAGFAAGAELAVASGLDGVEVDAGVLSLLRQFHSGLTNQRGDDYGSDRLRLTREILVTVRAAIGPDRVLGLRLSCDELAPWAGVTPEQAAEQVDTLAADLDLLVVVRGGPYSTTAYRPTAHTPPAFNLDLTRRVREVAAGRVPVVLQGSVVEVAGAQAALDTGAADLVEMTRAMIAEPNLVALVRAGHADQARPCILCNQACRVRDNRNPIISCVGEPRSGHETTDPSTRGRDPLTVDALVVGGGPAGLEAARVLAARGHRVRLAERTGRLGGTLRDAAVGPGRERLARLTDWLAAECHRLGVRVDLDTEIGPADLDRARADGIAVVLATGSRPAPRHAGLGLGPAAAGGTDPAPGGPPIAGATRGTADAATDTTTTTTDATTTADAATATADADAATSTGDPSTTPGTTTTGTTTTVTTADAAGHPAFDGPPVDDATKVFDVLDVLRGGPDGLPPGAVVVHDPIGGPIGVAAAEWLAGAGRSVALVTPDQIAGTLLSLTGDLAPANTRLAQAGVRREPRALLRAAGDGRAVLEDVWTGARREIDCAVLIDCGHRLPEETLYTARPGTPRAGDAVAPRTVLEAILEGRRRALEIGAAGPPRDTARSIPATRLAAAR